MLAKWQEQREQSEQRRGGALAFVAATSLCLLLCVASASCAQTETIGSFADLIRQASTRNIELRKNEITLRQATQAKLAALYGVADPTGGLSGSYKNNTRLPVSLFQAEILGGSPGTYEQVRLGLQHETNLNASVDIKLFNPAGWENLRLSRLDIDLTKSQNQLSRQRFYENLADIYFNILTLQAQQQSTSAFVATADSLLAITQQKYRQGLVAAQDLNTSRINLLNTQATEEQIIFTLSEQYAALKLLCDWPAAEPLSIRQEVPTDNGLAEPNPEIGANDFSIKNALLRQSYAEGGFRRARYLFYPTVSLFGSATTQRFSNDFGGNGIDWIPSSFIGLKATLPIPSGSTLAGRYRAKFDADLARLDAERAVVQAEVSREKLVAAYQKAASGYRVSREIYQLRLDTYQKNLLNYQAGITSPDLVLESFRAVVDSRFTLISEQIGIQLAKTKIDINNQAQRGIHAGKVPEALFKVLVGT